MYILYDNFDFINFFVILVFLKLELFLFIENRLNCCIEFCNFIIKIKCVNMYIIRDF